MFLSLFQIIWTDHLGKKKVYREHTVFLSQLFVPTSEKNIVNNYINTSCIAMTVYCFWS